MKNVLGPEETKIEQFAEIEDALLQSKTIIDATDVIGKLRANRNYKSI